MLSIKYSERLFVKQTYLHNLASSPFTTSNKLYIILYICITDAVDIGIKVHYHLHYPNENIVARAVYLLFGTKINQSLNQCQFDTIHSQRHDILI